MKKRGPSALLHLTDDLARFRQRLDHLLTFFPSSDSMVAFLQEIVKFIDTVHMFKEFSLHFIFRVSYDKLAGGHSKAL